MKKTFLILYEYLKIGGIEKNLIYMIKAYAEMGVRIIWMCYGNVNDTYEPWKQVLKDCSVEIIKTDIRYPIWLDYEKIHFDEDEEVFALCFDPTDFARLEQIASNYKNKFYLYYMVPHFERSLNYIEEYYILPFNRKRMVGKLNKIYNQWFKNGNILFFDKRHWVEMDKRYGIGGDAIYKDLVYQTPKRIRPFDEGLVRKKYNDDDFRIITCGRFDFPHKGYMFGLIDAFVDLKGKYPQIKLDIIGYGKEQDEKKIRSYLNKYPIECTKDIVFWGAVDPEEMINYFDRAKVNVSVAGGLNDGAKAGVLSIPARHYSYSCEVYGWLDGDASTILSDKPGEDLRPIIEKIINMSEDQYVDICKKSYETVCSKGESNVNWFFDRNNIITNYCSEADISFFKKTYRYVGKRRKFKSSLKMILDKISPNSLAYDKINGWWDALKK